MPISAGLREDIAVYRGFIGQQYFKKLFCYSKAEILDDKSDNVLRFRTFIIEDY